jgi:hypothetical protein
LRCSRFRLSAAEPNLGRIHEPDAAEHEWAPGALRGIFSAPRYQGRLPPAADDFGPPKLDIAHDLQIVERILGTVL